MLRRSFELAEHYLNRALALNPNRPTTSTALGVLYGFTGRAEEGIAYFRQAKIIDPNYELMRRHLGLIRKQTPSG